MSRHGPRAAVNRQAIGPVLQSRAAERPLPARTPAEPRVGGGSDRSFATVPVHAPGAGAERLPAQLRSGIEHLSGFAMGDVRVHRNSPAPAAVGAHAFTRGDDIHLSAGQERHLPHEAWHAVQQRQGRVAPTVRLGGVPASDDAGLEAEADRMGARAVAGPTTGMVGERATPSATPSGENVVQAKLMWKGAPVTAAHRPSSISQSFIDRPETYLLREDVKPHEPEIHVLDSSKKYLLGEFHESGVWETETEHWRDVPKVTEAYKTMPREAEDKAGVLEPAFDPNRMTRGRPLESAHPFLYVSLLQAHGDLDTLRQFMTTLVPDSPGQWTTTIGQAKTHLEEVRILFDNYYKPFESGFETKLTPRDRATVTPRLSMIYRIARRLDGALGRGGNLDTVHRIFAEIDAAHAAVPGPPPGWSAVMARRLEAQMSVLTDVAKDLVYILAANSEQERVLNRIVATDPGQRPDLLDALRPFRETSMAENVRRQPPPVLVQLGDAHVAGVAAQLGPEAVAVSVPRKLSDVTRRRPRREPDGDAEQARSP